jgi:hypothetical protein
MRAAARSQSATRYTCGSILAAWCEGCCHLVRTLSVSTRSIHCPTWLMIAHEPTGIFSCRKFSCTCPSRRCVCESCTFRPTVRCRSPIPHPDMQRDAFRQKEASRPKSLSVFADPSTRARSNRLPVSSPTAGETAPASDSQVTCASICSIRHPDSGSIYPWVPWI